MKKTKSALFNSMIALLLCAAMLLGTTFAWFTDEVTSTGNIIKTGTLDVKMTWTDDPTVPEDRWADASEGAIFNYRHWEPGYVDVKYVKIENVGSLAFKFRLDVIPASEARDGEVNLADVIDVYIFAADANVDRADIDEAEPVGTMSDLMADVDGAAYGVLLPAEDVRATNVELNAADKDLAVTGSVTYCIVLKMQEDAGNEYQNKKLGNGFAVQLLATQYGYEQDSFGNDYDNNATFPGDFAASAPVTVANGEVSEPATVGQEDGINASVPAGVKVAGGVTELVLTVNKLRSSEANIELERGETKTSLDIHMEGVAEDNTVPMLISLPGLLPANQNQGNVKLYHVENGNTVPMVEVNSLNELDAHNEFYYDTATGDVVLCVATFSEYVAVTNDNNPWNGGFNYTWYSNSTKETIDGKEVVVYYINYADELAGFGRIVDGTAEDIAADSFEGKVVKLGKDIDLGGTDSFNPIGCGYADSSINSNDVEGRVFGGTFDGQGHTISNLYQNGWNLGLSYCNLGGGLFASVKDATIQNLTMSNANIVMECVEQGIVAGLVQGTSKFDNINIYGCKIANYQKATGGLIGEVSGTGTTTITNVDIDATTVVGSLWGDFDCPVGGVIGARWDNESANPKIVMENVNVACRLDVYNDVTSSYQWYAYRRAGMLIGNTDTPPADGKHSATATADFLTCSNVVVIYGDWANYHYCQFTNYKSSWPWVRVEAGENCSSYSNPRYGRPNDVSGKQVTDSLHTHQDGDKCLELIPFHQLYGGGQGVYGQAEHEGVTEGLYTVTYIDHGEVFHVEYATSTNTPTLITQGVTTADAAESVLKNTYGITAPTGSTITGWLDNKGNTYGIGASITFTGDITLYPTWSEEHFVMCFDTNEKLIYSAPITGASEEDLTTYAENVDDALASIQQEVDHTGKVIVVSWDYDNYSDSNGNFDVSILKNATTDIVLKPKINLSTESITLVEVYDDAGNLVSYKVAGVENSDSNVSISIPAYVGTTPVTVIEGAFKGFDNLTAVRIPSTIESITANSFPGSTGNRETVTIYYDGDPNEWNSYMDYLYIVQKDNSYYQDYNSRTSTDATSTILDSSWDNGMGDGSRIFFLDEKGLVRTDGYWELIKHTGTWFLDIKYTWIYHAHEYNHSSTCSCSKKYDLATNYLEQDSSGNYTRPDYVYWTTERNSEDQ